jgi:GWxTD domain-containing protein
MDKRNEKKVWILAGPFVIAVMALASCGINLMPTKDVWFTQDYIIMQDFERDAYRTLSEPGKIAFHDLFWKYRTADAKGIFEARLDYVKKTFWKENSQQPWNTDRARTYLLNGSPAAIDYDQNIDFALTVLPGTQSSVSTDRSNEDIQANRAEIWTYQYDKYLIKYVFVFVQPTSWRMVQTALTNNRYLGEFENSSKTETFGISDPAAYKQDIAGLEKKK